MNRRGTGSKSKRAKGGSGGEKAGGRVGRNERAKPENGRITAKAKTAAYASIAAHRKLHLQLGIRAAYYSVYKQGIALKAGKQLIKLLLKGGGIILRAARGGKKRIRLHCYASVFPAEAAHALKLCADSARRDRA